MILSVHFLTGAAIGSRLAGEARFAIGAAKLKNYWAIFILAVLSHFVLDSLPHWEYLSQTQMADHSAWGLWLIVIKSLLDITMGSLLTLLFLRRSPRLKPVLFGAFCALLPDGFLFLFILFQSSLSFTPAILESFYWLHDALHFKEQNWSLTWKVAFEFASFALALFFLAFSNLNRQTAPPDQKS